MGFSSSDRKIKTLIDKFIDKNKGQKTCVNVAPSAKEKFVDSKCTNGFESYDLRSTVNQASLSKVLRSRREGGGGSLC